MMCYRANKRDTGKRWLLVILTIVACHVWSQATIRLQRRFDHTTGLTISAVFSLAQDSHGFIWIGTAGGLVRYDGSQMLPWAKETINRDVPVLSASPKGEVLAADGSGNLYLLTQDGAAPVIGPSKQPVTNVFRAEFDQSGRLWVVTNERKLLFRHHEHGTWHSIDSATELQSERPYRVRQGTNDRVYILTDKAIWQVRPGERPSRLFEMNGAIDLVEHPDGSHYVLVSSREVTGVYRVRNGRATLRAPTVYRPIQLALRGSVVWVSTSHTLTALRGEESPDVIGPEQDLPSGGPLLVDHEGDLWLGTFAGLLQYPEPDTIVWNQKDGLSSSHTRFLTKTEEGVWVVIWGPMGRVSRDAAGWKIHDEKIASHICETNRGLLVTGANSLMERRDGKFVRHSALPGQANIYGCQQVSDGTVLLATPRGIYRDHFDGAEPEFVSSPAGKDGQPASVFRVFEDSQERLWAATSDGRVCRSSMRAIVAKQPNVWSCQAIDDSPDIFDFLELPSGTLWMSTNRAGMWRMVGNQWEPIPASRTLASQVLFSLSPSPTLGVWLLGNGTAVRVVERTEIQGGWETVETLSAWEGLPTNDVGDLIDEAGGDLWLATSSGVVHVPAQARRANTAPPRIRLIDVVLNGQSVDGGSNEQASKLAYGSQVELHFAALSFRDRSLLRYQYRLTSDTPWVELRGSPVLRFVGLSAGNYQAEVRASLDGQNWTTLPARFSFQVLRPWYLQTWALIVFILVAGLILFAIYRTRIAMLLRLERQRAQIARDLHDEMGSGLGSIGILSGLAAENKLNDQENQELARKIAETAGELGTTLTEIVWALKPGATTLEALAYHLAERGGRLFPGNNGSFKTQFPNEWPKVELSLAVRRNLLLIASEAMHNAARHSRATEVILGFESAERGRWRLWLNDDGSGITATTDPNSSGLGLISMKRRAEEIGAGFSLTSNNGRGTAMSLVFDPRAGDGRVN